MDQDKVDATTEANEMRILNTGIMLANGLGKHLENSEFEEVIQSLPKATGQILNAVSPFIVRVLCGGATPEATEVEFMRKMFKDINLFFEKRNKELDDIQNLIEWSKYKFPFENVKSRLEKLSVAFSSLCNAQKRDIDSQRNKFIQLCNSEYQNDAEKFYSAIKNSNNQYQESLLSVGKKGCKNDRRNMQKFMSGILQLLLRGVVIHLSYRKLQSDTIGIEKEIDLWLRNIEQVRGQMKTLDDEIARSWKEQCEADIDQLAKYYSPVTLDNKMFSMALYDKLSRKYYWRDWFVLVYKPLVGGDKHWVGVTEGHIKYRINKRNIAVASVDQNKRPINQQEATEILKGMDVTKWTVKDGVSEPSVTKNAHEVFDAFHSKVGKTIMPFASMGVIQTGNDVHYQCKAERFVHFQKDGLYDMHLFG